MKSWSVSKTSKKRMTLKLSIFYSVLIYSFYIEPYELSSFELFMSLRYFLKNSKTIQVWLDLDKKQKVLGCVKVFY